VQRADTAVSWSSRRQPMHARPLSQGRSLKVQPDMHMHMYGKAIGRPSLAVQVVPYLVNLPELPHQLESCSWKSVKTLAMTFSTDHFVSVRPSDVFIAICSWDINPFSFGDWRN
jgi:hypothetical protein